MMVNYLRRRTGKFAVKNFLKGKKTYYVTGMRRSGNHAFINWLANAIKGRSTTLAPYSDRLHISKCKQIIFFDEINKLSAKKYLGILYKYKEIINSSQHVIISTEDCPPNYHTFKVPDFDHGFFIKRSILNLISSRIRFLKNMAHKGIGYRDLNVDKHFFSLLEKWKSNDSLIVWNYDRWISSKNYRLSFLDSLGLKVDILPSVSIQGGGSSFTGREKQPKEEGALNRYKSMDFSEPVLDLLVEYKELLEPEEKQYLVEEYSVQL